MDTTAKNAEKWRKSIAKCREKFHNENRNTLCRGMATLYKHTGGTHYG
jgi:hypothetical protein